MKIAITGGALLVVACAAGCGGGTAAPRHAARTPEGWTFEKRSDGDVVLSTKSWRTRSQFRGTWVGPRGERGDFPRLTTATGTVADWWPFARPTSTRRSSRELSWFVGHRITGREKAIACPDGRGPVWVGAIEDKQVPDLEAAMGVECYGLPSTFLLLRPVNGELDWVRGEGGELVSLRSALHEDKLVTAEQRDSELKADEAARAKREAARKAAQPVVHDGLMVAGLWCIGWRHETSKTVGYVDSQWQYETYWGFVEVTLPEAETMSEAARWILPKARNAFSIPVDFRPAPPRGGEKGAGNALGANYASPGSCDAALSNIEAHVQKATIRR